MKGLTYDTTVQIVSTTLGLGLAYLIVDFWRARKKIDPSIDPLRGGADPNFPGGKPIEPTHRHDSNDFKRPSCQIYNPSENLFENLGNPALDKDKIACLASVNQGAIVRYIDSDNNIFWMNDSIFDPNEARGTCFFADQNDKLFSFPISPVNGSQRLCFNASDTIGGSALFFVPDNAGGVFVWNPNVNFATANPKVFAPFNGVWEKVDDGTHLNLLTGKEKDEVQVLTNVRWFGGANENDPIGDETFGKVFYADETATTLDPEIELTSPNKRLYLPSQGKIVYLNPYATDKNAKFVEYPLLSN